MRTSYSQNWFQSKLVSVKTGFSQNFTDQRILDDFSQLRMVCRKRLFTCCFGSRTSFCYCDMPTLQMKNVKRRKGRRFTSVAQPGKTEEVKVTGGRPVRIESSDSEEEALAKVRRQQKRPVKHAKTSATRTGTTPTASPSESQTSDQAPESPMDTSTAQTSLTLVTAPASPVVSRPATPKPDSN